ncbi:MAG: zinc ribbon domain-containing protein [Proteobacteria bacterium]|nr:zinc ribbon domain-containing protein [Pseudomonadota bacterium]
MPIYEYECTGCGKRFEIFQKISDKPLTKCNFCKGPLSKLISSCSFHLKGTGWYATDYKKPIDSAGKKASSGNGEDHADTTETTETASTETTTETKSETKTETKTESTSA